jgi:hypothetical protein
VLVASKIELHSPNYPSNYGNQEDCRWFIRSEMPGRVLTLTVLDFVTENRYDVLRAGVGDNVLDQGARYIDSSGNDRPNGFESHNPVMWITFTTDAEKTERGFSLEIVDQEYVDVRPCDRVPCINGGTCMDGMEGAFSCICSMCGQVLIAKHLQTSTSVATARAPTEPLAPMLAQTTTVTAPWELLARTATKTLMNAVTFLAITVESV